MYQSVDPTGELQELFNDSSFDKTFVKDTFRDCDKNIIATIVYPVTYDLSREIFKVVRDLKSYNSIYKTTTAHNKYIEILKLSF